MIKSLNNDSLRETEMQSWRLAGSSLMNRFALLVMIVTDDGDDGDGGDDGGDGEGDDGDYGCFVPFVLLTNGDGGDD